MKVLVTGGGGFIGSHLVERLVREGHAVRVLDNFATGRRENLVPFLGEVELTEGDIQSYERAHTAVRGVEAVFHQAALPSVPRSMQDPLTSNASNVIGTLNLLLAARDSGVRRVIFASSSSVYGADATLPKHEELMPLPISPYGASKLAAESYCRAFWEVYELQTVALRYFNVFGPRQDPLSQYAAVIPNFITAALAGTPAVVFGDGEQSRDFTFVSNVVEANLLAIHESNAVGRVLNVAGGQRTSLNELIQELESALGREVEASYESPRPGEVKHSQADVSLARSVLGYEPKVSLREGLAATVAYFEEHPVPAGASHSIT